MFIRPVISAEGGLSQAELWDNVISAWEFDGTVYNPDPGNVYRDEVETHHFTSRGASNGATTGVIGNGRGGVADVTSGLFTDYFDFSTPTDFTIMFWVEWRDSGAYSVVFNLAKADRSRDYLRLYKNNTNTTSILLLNDSGVPTYLGYPAYAANVWQHIAIVYTHSTTNWKCYRNGIEVIDNSSIAAPFADWGSVRFEWTYDSPQGAGGYVDLARFFNRALTEDQVIGHYNSGAGLSYLDT